ncbi:hypothetical protein FGIG_06013, partial [Fasciola gigantica]
FFLTISIQGIPVADKYALIISARVHPGESNSSWMMLGLMQQLIDLDPDAQELRKRFLICLVPMLNPDGVILGNYRCQNSHHRYSKFLLYGKRLMFDELHSVYESDTFIFGVATPDIYNVPESFSLPSCRFSIHPSKEATGRVVFWREFNLTHSFTLEATFNGSRKMRDTLKHFDVNDFALIGRRLGSTLLILRNILADPK